MLKRIGIRLLSLIAPKKVLGLAYKNLTTPQIKKLRLQELEALKTARQEDYLFHDFIIKTYQWGTGDKSIMLIHGWEGQAGNFSELIPHLVLAGYKVFAFDGPSHGFSTEGKTSLFEFTVLVGELIAHWKVTHLISHSFGGVATTYALYQNPQLKIEKYVLFTTPDKFIERIDYVCEHVGIPNTIKRKLIKKIEKETGVDAKSLNVSDFVKEIAVTEALIIHDANDRVVPIMQAINVASCWDAATLIKTEGTGHFRILRTEEVHRQVINFLTSK